MYLVTVRPASSALRDSPMVLTINQEGTRQPMQWRPAPTTEPSSPTARDVAEFVTKKSALSIPTGQ
jgi:hypothetical protein